MGETFITNDDITDIGCQLQKVLWRFRITQVYENTLSENLINPPYYNDKTCYISFILCFWVHLIFSQTSWLQPVSYTHLVLVFCVFWMLSAFNIVSCFVLICICSGISAYSKHLTSKIHKKLTHTPQSHTIKPIWSTRSLQEATIIIVNQHICLSLIHI